MPHAHPSGFPSPCNDRGGQAPALREKTAPFTVGRGPVPRHAFGYRQTASPPVGKDRLILTCSGASTPELQRWAQCLPVGETSRSRLLLVGETHEPKYTQLNHRAESDMSAANGYIRCL